MLSTFYKFEIRGLFIFTSIFNYFLIVILFGSFLAFGQSKTDEILSLNPYFYEDFEDISTTKFFNDITTSATLEWVNDARPVLIDGPRGKAMDFHQSNSAFRIHSYGNYQLGNYTFSKGFTCSFWIKHQYDHNTDPNQRFFAQHNNFQLLYSQGLTVIFNNEGQRILGTEILDGEWHHVVIIADFNSDNNNVKAYVDNDLSNSLTFDFSSGFSDADSRRSFYVGKRDIGNNFTNVSLDEVALFNRALSDYEINQLFQLSTVINPDTTQKFVQINNNKTIVAEGTSVSIDLEATTNISNANRIDWEVIHGSGQVETDGLKATVNLSNDRQYQHAKIKMTVGNDQHEASGFINVVRVQKKAPNTRTLSALPSSGIHPRILFGPEDLEDQRARYNNVSYIQTSVDYMIPRSESKPIPERTAFDYTLLGYHALMENNQSNLNNLATEFADHINQISQSYVPEYDNRLVHDVDMYVAFAYDFLFNNMSTSDQETVRNHIAKMIANRKCFGGFAQGIELEQYSTNWSTFHDNIVVCAASIEGEPGENPQILTANEDKIRNFLCYNGVRESGFPREGYGYFNFGMGKGIYSCMIHARRGENFFETSNFHKALEIGLREQQPWIGGTMYSHHDGQGWGTGFFLGDPLWVAKYMYPNDSMVDTHVKTYADYFAEPRKMQLATMVFGENTIPNNNDPGKVGSQLGLSTTAVDLERGIINTRSKWGEDMVRFDFECRMDGYYMGHMHSDRNMFTLSGHGRQWISDNDYHDTKSDEHATVLIDGLAYDCGNRSSWRSGPGKLLRYDDTDRHMLAQGDATFAYNYSFSGNNDPDNQHISQTWSEFTYPGTEIPDWQQSGSYSQLGTMKKLEDVEKAIRTVVFIKGDYPFALIVDDIKKDDATHQYEWVANIPFDPQNQMEFLFDTPIKTENQLLLQYKEDTSENAAQLLVQLLDATGNPETFDLIMRDIGTYDKESDPNIIAMRHMISMKRENVLNPNFKILLYPHRKGFPTPEIVWNEDRTELGVTIEDIVTTFEFSTDVDGNTVVNVIEPYGSFSDQPFTIPGKIEFEDYNRGGQGIAYSDSTPKNSGNVYRQDDVDIIISEDNNVGFSITSTANNEYVNYTIDVSETALYDFKIRQASILGNLKFHIEIDGVDISNTQNGIATETQQTYDDIILNEIQLNEGIHELKFYIESGEANLNYLDIQLKEPLSVEGIDKKEKLKIVPNPGSDLVKIHGLKDLNTEWKLVNTFGQILKEGIGDTIITNDLAAGVFFLIVNQSTTLYLVKK